MSEIVNDIRNGALSVREIPGFLLWWVRKNIREAVSAVVILAEIVFLFLVISGMLPV